MADYTMDLPQAEVHVDYESREFRTATWELISKLKKTGDFGLATRLSEEFSVYCPVCIIGH